MKPRSIRFRLTIWYALALAVILVIVSAVVYFYVTQSLAIELDASLEGDAQELLTRIKIVDGKIDRTQLLALDAAYIRDAHKAEGIETELDDEDFTSDEVPRPRLRYEQVIAQDSTIVFKTGLLGKLNLPYAQGDLQQALKNSPMFVHIMLDDVPFRMIIFHIQYENAHIGWGQVAISEHYVRSAARQLLLILLTCIPLGSGLAYAGGWVLARKALQPIDRITLTTQRIEAENLDERIPLHEVDDEVGRLTNTLNDLLSRLQASFTQIQQFTADASHELRTPLTVMRGEIEVALRSDRSPERYRDTLSSLLEEIDRMADIVEGLLTLSRAESGELPLLLKPLRLDDLVYETYEYGRMLAAEKNITMRLDLVEPVVVEGDPLRLREAMLNLLDNAVKYTASGGLVTLSLTKEHGETLISVQDTGEGISAQDVSQIFQRFYRGDKSHSSQNSGYGLGLAIAKWIVEAHHGRITVESTVGQGSRFTICLPQTKKSVEDVQMQYV